MSPNKLLLKETVPLIDLSKCIGELTSEVNTRSPAVCKVVKEIRNACLQWGFFYLVGHGVESELINELKAVGTDFFHQPKEEKKLILRQPVGS